MSRSLAQMLVVCAGLACLASADTRIVTCQCDHAKPETLDARQCGLCREAEKQPASIDTFFLKDINPTKPNRWLALPHRHYASMADLPAPERATFWKAAIAEAQELYPDKWGIAVNGPRLVTQCHPHAHISIFITAVETRDGATVKDPADIVVPQDAGIWFHPVPGGYHVHSGEQITETVLLR
jgi:diadenosine tetraphosphate (Ap4A) HIT family hydrolase